MTTESILAHQVSSGQREWFSTVADVLIPGDGEMPSASAVDIGGELLDRALRARPDLLRAFDAVLGGIEQTTDIGELRSRIDSFASGHRVEFDDFGHLLAGAYLHHQGARDRRICWRQRRGQIDAGLFDWTPDIYDIRYIHSACEYLDFRSFRGPVSGDFVSRTGVGREVRG